MLQVELNLLLTYESAVLHSIVVMLLWNTCLLCMGKYISTADLLSYWFGFICFAMLKLSTILLVWLNSKTHLTGGLAYSNPLPYKVSEYSLVVRLIFLLLLFTWVYLGKLWLKFDIVKFISLHQEKLVSLDQLHSLSYCQGFIKWAALTSWQIQAEILTSLSLVMHFFNWPIPVSFPLFSSFKNRWH